MSRPTGEEEPFGDGEDSDESYFPPLENFELNYWLISTTRQLTEACQQLDEQAATFATAHRDFKREWAKAFLASGYKTVDAKKADADIVADELRFQNYLHQGLMKAALERVRSLRGILSSYQTIGNRQTEEMKFSRTGPPYEK